LIVSTQRGILRAPERLLQLFGKTGWTAHKISLFGNSIEPNHFLSANKRGACRDSASQTIRFSLARNAAFC
jgi:hypothetical protein